MRVFEYLADMELGQKFAIQFEYTNTGLCDIKHYCCRCPSRIKYLQNEVSYFYIRDNEIFLVVRKYE